MTVSDLNARLFPIVSQTLNVPLGDVTEDAGIATDFNADSLDAVELIMGVEEEFGFEIPDRRAEDIITVRDLINLVEELSDTA